MIPSMTSAEPGFTTKYCQHHYFDKPVTQEHGGPGKWPLNTERGSGLVCGFVLVCTLPQRRSTFPAQTSQGLLSQFENTALST